MSIQRSTCVLLEDDGSIVRLSFREPIVVASSEIPQFLDDLDQSLSKTRSPGFIVDLKNLTALGSGGLLLFESLSHHAQRRGGRCIFFGASFVLMPMLRHLGIPDQYRLVESEADARNYVVKSTVMTSAGNS